MEQTSSTSGIPATGGIGMKHIKGEYPDNLAQAILQREDYYSKHGALMAVICLSDREQDIITSRYKDKKTLKEIARDMSVTPERIRQIEAKAIRKMRNLKHTREIKCISLGEHERRMIAYKQQVEEKMKIKEQELREYYAESFGKAKSISEIPYLSSPYNFLSRPVEDLDLSIRAYNCLKRANIHTVGALMDITETQLSRVRNLGLKSVEEIKVKLDQLGGKMKQWEELK